MPRTPVSPAFPLDARHCHRSRLRHRREQAAERLFAGPAWEDNGLIIATRPGRPSSPAASTATLALLVHREGLPRLTSHGLRHTAATHMVEAASDLGELRAIADILGHSPEILLRVYAHALPTLSLVADRISRRGTLTAGDRGQIRPAHEIAEDCPPWCGAVKSPRVRIPAVPGHSGDHPVRPSNTGAEVLAYSASTA